MSTYTPGPYQCRGRLCIRPGTRCLLHAAAPALLEALEAMLLNRELGEAESQHQGKPRMIEVNDMARAALRAAKGG